MAKTGKRARSEWIGALYSLSREREWKKEWMEKLFGKIGKWGEVGKVEREVLDQIFRSFFKRNLLAQSWIGDVSKRDASFGHDNAIDRRYRTCT